MIAVTAFLCSIALAPADCDRGSAIDVLTFPPSANELACQRDAMQTLAGLSIRADAGHYWLIRCAYTSIGKETVG